MRILGIDHVQVTGPPGSEPEVRAFYGEVLGLEELPRPRTLPDRYGCWFQAGAQELHVVSRNPSARHGRAIPASSSTI